MTASRSAKMTALTQKSRATAQALASCRHLIKASLGQVRVTCGKPSCRCAKGLRHAALAFTYKLKGRSMSMHVPKAMASQARQAAADYAKLKQLVEMLSENNMQQFKLKARTIKRRT